jgi:hypothetical protein
MSIAALASVPAVGVRRSATSATVDAPEPVRALPRVTRELPVRSDLLDAMNEALRPAAEGGMGTDGASQPVLRFAHALMSDLRALPGGQTSRTPAWGDLSQRLSALATAAAQPVDTPPAAPEIPDQPNPLTSTTAAVHIMKVPTSRLLEAFVAMHRALGQQSDLQAGDERKALADLAKQLAGAVAPVGATSVKAGAVLDVKA